MTTRKQPPSPLPSPLASPPIDRALSILEPWGFLIAAGFKGIENRSWATEYRGCFAIHCSLSDRELRNTENYDLVDIHPGIEAAFEHPRFAKGDMNVSPADYLFKPGASIGSVEIVDCVHADDAESDLLTDPSEPAEVPRSPGQSAVAAVVDVTAKRTAANTYAGGDG